MLLRHTQQSGVPLVTHLLHQRHRDLLKEYATACMHRAPQEVPLQSLTIDRPH
jgi:hypothetical protein